MKRLLTAFYETPWAIQPHLLPVIRDVLHRWADGHKLSSEQIVEAIGDAPAEANSRRRRANAAPRGIAVLPVLGILSQRTAGDVSTPGTATDTVRRQFAELMNDSRVDAIVLDIDSPGGSVFGVQELAADIMAARGRKKVIASANSLAASAAYWIGSAADEMSVTPGGQVGSIGVIAAHEDHSKRLEAEGIDVTLITAGKFKGEGNPFGPLGEEAHAAIQADIDTYYQAFTGDVSRQRGVPMKQVLEGFGQGRTLAARDAMAAGMVDRIETLDETLGRLMSRPRALNPKRSAGVARRRARLADLSV